MRILLAKYKIFLGKGALPLATPARGPAPWTPVNSSRKRSASSLRSQLIESHMFKIFISLREMYSFVTCKSLVIYILIKKSRAGGNIAENYNCQKLEFYQPNLNNNLISEISQKGTAYFHIKQLKENACIKRFLISFYSAVKYHESAIFYIM